MVLLNHKRPAAGNKKESKRQIACHAYWNKSPRQFAGAGIFKCGEKRSFALFFNLVKQVQQFGDNFVGGFIFYPVRTQPGLVPSQ